MYNGINLQLSRVGAAHIDRHGLAEYRGDESGPRPNAQAPAELEHGGVGVVCDRLPVEVVVVAGVNGTRAQLLGCLNALLLFITSHLLFRFDRHKLK